MDNLNQKHKTLNHEKHQDQGQHSHLDPDVLYDGQSYLVAGAGAFKHAGTYTFEEGILPSGLAVSRDFILDSSAPFSHEFREECVYIGPDGTLKIIVPGGQRVHDQGERAFCGEVHTVENRILHCSVRTVAKFSNIPGVCHGIFFYKNDNAEIDIEYITDPCSLSNPGNGQPPAMLYTNQPRHASGKPTPGLGDAPKDVGVAHEYRLDWTAEATKFYVDGELQARLVENVPTVPGCFVWNNWCNGDKGWTGGPPTEDASLDILKITMYYNLSIDQNSAG